MLSGVALGELLESPIGADGSFTFGHLPKGSYLLSLFPAPPGMPSRAFRVEETDVARGPCRDRLSAPSAGESSSRMVHSPTVGLGSLTESSYMTAHINADGTFRTELQPARHKVELAGMPGGYSLASVRLGTQDVSRGVAVGAGDISGLVITVAPPAHLPKVRGKVVGVPAGNLDVREGGTDRPRDRRARGAVQQDGSFEFAAVTPGTYRVRVPQVPSVTPSFVVVGWEDTEIQVGTTPGR